jgi:hypothetical protein
MSVPALSLTFVDPSTVVGMDALWTELPEHRRPFEIVLIVPGEDKGRAPGAARVASRGAWQTRSLCQA